MSRAAARRSGYKMIVLVTVTEEEHVEDWVYRGIGRHASVRGEVSACRKEALDDDECILIWKTYPTRSILCST